MPPLIRDSGLSKYVNWHENISQKLQTLYDIWNEDPQQSSLAGYVDTTAGLLSLVDEALQKNQSLRGLGGTWSFSPVAATDGILVNTKPLDYRFPAPATHPSFQRDRSNLLFVQCGISVAELSHFLKSIGKALPTSGASNGQTIAGALSAGTHGSALAVGSVQDYVVGLHVVVAPDRHVWLERETDPVTDDAIPQGMGAQLVRDDSVFDAALVSFGSFGFIHGVLLEAEPLYTLQAYRQRMDLTAELWQAMDQLDFSALQLPGNRPIGTTPFHFQVVMDPNDFGPGPGHGPYATVMFKEKAPPLNCRPPTSGGKIAQGDGALEVIGALTDLVPNLTPALTTLLVGRFYQDFADVCGSHGDIFTDTTTRGEAASCAMGLPLGAVRGAVELALAEYRKYSFAGLLALRYVKATRATLGFTRFAPATAVLEIDGPWSTRTQTYYRRVWRALDNAGIPYTFHWGKLNDLDANRVRAMYDPQSIASWLDARRSLLTMPTLRAVFANDFLRQLNLHT